MPDLSDYFKLGRAAQALGGPGPGMPAGPINPYPAAAAAYGRPRGGFPQLAGLNDNWRNRGLPEELQPLAGDAMPSEAESALSAAIRGQGVTPSGSNEIMKSAAPQTAGPSPMQITVGGGGPQSPPLERWKQDLMASASEPVMMAGGFQTPHKWGVGPVRMMGESQTQANARDEADYAGRMDAAKTAYAGAQAQSGMMMSHRGQQMNALNDLLKNQGDEAFKNQHLKIQQQEADQRGQEVGPFATAKRQWDARKAMEQDRLTGQNATKDEQATFWKNWNATNPEPSPSSFSLGKGNTPGVLPTPAAPPAPGGRTPAQPSAPAGDAKSSGDFTEGIPSRIKEMMDRTAVIDKETMKPSGRERPKAADPGTVMDEYFQMAQSDPRLRDPDMVKKTIAKMREQYQPKDVDDALKKDSMLAEGFQTIANAPLGTVVALGERIDKAIPVPGISQFLRAAGILPSNTNIEVPRSIQVKDFFRNKSAEQSRAIPPGPGITPDSRLAAKKAWDDFVKSQGGSDGTVK